MKTKLLLTLLITLILPNCMNAQKSDDEKKILVAYYSWGGNTRQMATQIAELTGADVYEIVPLKAYTTDYDDCCDVAKEEIKKGYKPVLRDSLPYVAKYDVVIVGSPCWWSTVAPPVKTFLEGCNLVGKTVLPFMTHGGSGMGRSESDIKKMCPNSTLLKGLPVYGTSVANSKDEVRNWLQKTGIIK